MFQSFRGRRVRRNLDHRRLVTFLVLLLTVTACNGQDPVASLPVCSDESYPAVRLEMVDESNEPLIGATLRYRQDDGPWQQWPEGTGRTTVIRGGPGLYQIELGKEGFGGTLTQVDVPASGEDACQPIAQTARLQMTRTPCPSPPQELTLTVDPPLAGLQASLMAPVSGRRQLECGETDSDGCRSFSFLVDKLGDYSIKLEGLPGLGAMMVVDDGEAGQIIAYDPPAVDLRLEHRGLAQTADASGQEEVELSFPVRHDEANCSLADLREMQTGLGNEEAAELGPRPPVSLQYLGSLTMTDLGAEACQVEPAPETLYFGAVLPDGTHLDDVRVQVEYGQGWRPADCEFGDGRYICQVEAPNPLLNHPFVARVLIGQEETIGLSLPFGGLCLIFH